MLGTPKDHGVKSPGRHSQTYLKQTRGYIFNLAMKNFILFIIFSCLTCSCTEEQMRLLEEEILFEQQDVLKHKSDTQEDIEFKGAVYFHHKDLN